MDKYQRRSILFVIISVVLAAVIGWFASYVFTIQSLEPWYDERSRTFYIMDGYGNINIYD